ncbi:MAG: ATP-grasp domain-containing protein [Deltaproteobacteria bacterium]|nr:ATP-grasp domain-containing protein [Deltaproteobacteria bacterium]
MPRRLIWLLQANLRDRSFLATLKEVLGHLGEDWQEAELIPFSDHVPALPFDAAERSIVCYGPSFVPRVASRTTWKPGIFFDEALFRWSVMARHWGDLMFSNDGTITTAGDVLEELTFGGAPLFVRPDEDTKAFDGGVYEDAATLRQHLGSTDPATTVIKASMRPVDAEWRCFIVGNEVVDSSEYRRAGRPSLHRSAPPRAIELAHIAAERWLPAEVTCIDIASSGAYFGVVEANCFNASRFYAADPATVLAAVAAHVGKAG